MVSQYQGKTSVKLINYANFNPVYLCHCSLNRIWRPGLTGFRDTAPRDAGGYHFDRVPDCAGDRLSDKVLFYSPDTRDLTTQAHIHA